MKRTSKTLALPFSLIALAISLSACGTRSESPAAGTDKADSTAQSAPKDEGIKLSAEEIRNAGIKLASLKQESIAASFTATATIQPNQDRYAQIAAPVEGRVVSISAALGETVKGGQTLAILDSVALGEATSARTSAQAALRIAESDFKRAEALHRDEIIATKDFLLARAQFERARAELRAAEDRVRLLGGEAGSSGRVSSRVSVKAPFSGTVVMRKASTGELASPASPLFAVADLSKVWIEASLPENLLSQVRPGARAQVTVTAYPGERFEGRVTLIASMFDKDSRTVPARIEVANRDGRLKPDMFASARIESEAAAHTGLFIPDEAVILLQGQPTVFVARGAAFEARAVDLGDKLNGRSAVKSGLRAGEQIAVSGAYALKAHLLKSQIGDES
ncbi:efflux RND transporter periplasmic adaptor subunit [Niveibacterium terrae]|uniref:efflux RND transporter periplasmic adaptor subunit n=1 Tax=Niveibacterium terrae TaxID=3373598 RepID=UPI003A8D2538